MTPTDALLNTTAATHGLELAGKAKTPATANTKGRKRIEEDDALSAQQSSEQADVTADAGSAQATSGAGPILLAQADTGVPAEQAAPTESLAGGAGTGTTGSAGAVGDNGGTIKLALGGLALGGIALAAGGGGGGGSGGGTPVDSQAPIFSSNAITSVAENTDVGTVIHTVHASDNVGVAGYSLAGGADDGKFTLDPTTGELRFKASPDFETPASAAGSNTYTLKVKATDAAGNGTEQTVTVNVTNVAETLQAQLIDSPVSGVEVWANGQRIGTTDANGYFNFTEGQVVTFKIGNVIIGENVSVPADNQIYVQDLLGIDRNAGVTSDPRIATLAQLLQSLDADQNPNNGIDIDASRLRDQFVPVRITSTTQVGDLLDIGITPVERATALDHLNDNSPFLKGWDNTAPSAEITIGKRTLLPGETTEVTIRFSEAVDWDTSSLFDLITVDNATLGTLFSSDGGLTYKGELTPKVGVIAIVDGTDHITLDMSKMVDEAGNAGRLITSDGYTVGVHLKTADEVFASMGESATAGQYRTMFEMAAASYVHLGSMSSIPAMGQETIRDDEPSHELQLDSKENLLDQGISFAITAQELGLQDVSQFDSNNISTEGSFYHDGYFISYVNDDGTAHLSEKSSVALVGRTQNELFIAFRGTDPDVPGDIADDAFWGNVSMSEHYARYQPLFDGVNEYLKVHTEITQVYVGGHSLGGEMATIFMQNHLDGDVRPNISYDSITFEAANKNLGNNLQASAATERSLNFEMWSDWVSDLSYTNIGNSLYANYGNTVHLTYEKDYGYETFFGVDYFPVSHYMVSINDEINRVLSELPPPDQFRGEKRIYIDQADNGFDVLVTNNLDDVDNLSGAIGDTEERNELINSDLIKENGNQHWYNIIWSNPSAQHTLIIKPIVEGWYEVPVTTINNIVLSNEADKKFNVNAHQAAQDTFIIGNDSDNIIQGSAHNDILFGSGGVDVLIGGDGQDQLYGADYADLHEMFDSRFSSNPTALTVVNQHAASDLNDQQTYIIAGSGADNVACTSNNSDFIFVDVEAVTRNAGNVDTIHYFEDNLLGDSDYLIFSAEQLGITQDIANGNLVANQPILNKEAWEYDKIKSDITSKFFISANGDVDFSLDGNQANAFHVAKISPDNGSVDIKAHNILIVDSFTDLKYDDLTLATNTPPVFASAGSAQVAENTAATTVVYDANATDNGGASDVGIKYSLLGTDQALFSIDENTGEVRFKASPDYETQTDSGANNVYDFTVRATDASNSYADRSVALTVTDVAETVLAGDLIIPLGAYGNLILPVQVEGNWYYFWDMSGDGTGNNMDDLTTHGALDALFTQDINGNTNPGVDTTDTYRYATLNGVRLALPTANGGMGYPNGIDAAQPGTAVADGTTTNTTYDELLAIWDAYNGTGTGLYDEGTPSGWPSDVYWSATPSASGHADIALYRGYVSTDGGYGYVALQVLEAVAPVFSSGATASMVENTAISSTVYDATADGDLGITYTVGGTDSSLFNINASTGVVTFKASPNYEAPVDADGNNVYDFVVTATDGSGNTANQTVALSVSDVTESTYTPGQSEINLGDYGKLIAPVQVEGKWYYYWDRSGDGTSANAGSLNGGRDYATHDVLDGIFTQDISGNTNSYVDTTDTYRYATLNGVHLALPTANGGMAYPRGIDQFQPGTAVADGTTTNTTYDELLVIWDAYNGTGTGRGMSGTPSGWQSNGYWSATPSAWGHAAVDLSGGYVSGPYDDAVIYVALQVL